jgi:hypothetical protein
MMGVQAIALCFHDLFAKELPKNPNQDRIEIHFAASDIQLFPIGRPVEVSQPTGRKIFQLAEFPSCQWLLKYVLVVILKMI